MAISTFGGPVVLAHVPDRNIAAPARYTAVRPVGDEATYTEDSTTLEVESYPDDGNINGPDGSPGALAIVTGRPSATFAAGISPLQPGNPDQASTYTITDDSSQVQLGASPPYVPTGGETIIGSTSYGTNGYKFPDILAAPDGRLIVVAEHATGASGNGVAAFYKDYADANWTAASDELWTSTTTFSANVHPSPHLFFVYSNSSVGYTLYCVSLELIAATTQKIRIDYSNNGGEDWSFMAYAPLTFTVSSIYYEIKGVLFDTSSNSLTMVIRKDNASVYTALTYVSDDLGATWTYASTGDISNAVNIAIAFNGCQNQILAMIDTSNHLNVYSRIAGSPAWTSKATSLTAATAYSSSHLAMVILPDQTILIYVRDNGTPNYMSVVASADGGKSWGSLTDTTSGTDEPEYPYNDNNDTFSMVDESGGALLNGVNLETAAYTAGRVYIVGNFTSAAAVDRSLYAAKFGGQSNIQFTDTTNADAAYYPANKFSTKMTGTWSYSGAAAEVLAVDSAGNLVTKIGDGTTNAAGSFDNGWDYNYNSAHFIFGPDSSGGSTSDSYFVVRVGATNLTNRVIAEVRINATTHSVQFYDVVNASNLGTAVSYTAGVPIEFFVAVNYDTLTGSAWWKPSNADVWTEIATNQTLVSEVNASGLIVVGKLSSNTARVDIMWGQRRREGWYADGTPPQVKGIPAYSTPDLIPTYGIYVKWRGAPLLVGNSFVTRSVSPTPITRLSPMRVAPSPSMQYKSGTGTAARTEYHVLDGGLGHKSRISTNMVGLSGLNVQWVSAVSLDYYDGADFQSVFSGTVEWEPFGAAGAVGFQRSSASSCLFRPRLVTKFLEFREGQLEGWLVKIAAGANTITAVVKKTHPGLWNDVSNTTIPMGIEIDPTTITEVSGSFASLSTSTTSGTITLYPPDFTVVGTQSVEADRYYRIGLTFAPGVTQLQAGIVYPGPVYAMSRPYGDGSSIQSLTRDQLTYLPGSGFTSSKTTKRRRPRVLNLPYNEILVHQWAYTEGANLSGLSWDGSTVRALADNNLSVIGSLHDVVGQAVPFTVVVDATLSADPGSSVQVFRGPQVLFGRLGDVNDTTAQRGFHFPVQEAGGFNMHGAALTVTEEV